MAQIGNVPEINGVKDQLSELKSDGLVTEWELPYENILTRLDAAIFFFTPASDSLLPGILEKLKQKGTLQSRPNEEMTLSKLNWRVEFNHGNG